jgi:hypothetical protein
MHAPCKLSITLESRILYIPLCAVKLCLQPPCHLLIDVVVLGITLMVAATVEFLVESTRQCLIVRHTMQGVHEREWDLREDAGEGVV